MSCNRMARRSHGAPGPPTMDAAQDELLRMHGRGGLRQRRRQREAAAAGNAQVRAAGAGAQAMGHLSYSLLQMWAWGTLSAKSLQKLAADAVRDGCPEHSLHRLSRLGGAGTSPNNCHRDLLEYLRRVGMPEPPRAVTQNASSHSGDSDTGGIAVHALAQDACTCIYALAHRMDGVHHRTRRRVDGLVAGARQSPRPTVACMARRADGEERDPLALRPAARDPAGHLGHQPDAAATGTQRFRRAKRGR